MRLSVVVFLFFSFLFCFSFIPRCFIYSDTSYAAGVPHLPPQRPPGLVPLSQRHGVQPEVLRVRLVVQLRVRGRAFLLPRERCHRPPGRPSAQGRPGG